MTMAIHQRSTPPLFRGEERELNWSTLLLGRFLMAPSRKAKEENKKFN
jgi:hypothetical protein